MITPLRGSKLIQIVDHANVGQSVLAQVIAYDHLCTIRLAGEYAAVSAGTGVLEIGKGGVSRSFNYQLSLLQQAYDNGIFDRVLPQYVNDWKTVHLTISREFLERVIPNELCDVFRQYTLDPAFREQFDAYAGCLEKYFSEEGTQNFYEALCDAHLPIPEHVPEKLVPRNDVVAILATDSGALNLAEQIYRDRDRLIKKKPIIALLSKVATGEECEIPESFGMMYKDYLKMFQDLKRLVPRAVDTVVAILWRR